MKEKIIKFLKAWGGYINFLGPFFAILFFFLPFVSHAAILASQPDNNGTITAPNGWTIFSSATTTVTYPDLYFKMHMVNKGSLNGISDLGEIFTNNGGTGNFHVDCVYSVTDPTNCDNDYSGVTNGSDFIEHYSSVTFTGSQNVGYAFSFTGVVLSAKLAGTPGFYCLATTLAEAQTCSDTPTGPSISFLFPVQSTSTPWFSSWLFNLSGLIATHTYTAQVHWQLPNEYPNISFQPTYGPVFGDQSAPFSGTSTGVLAIPHPTRDLQTLNSVSAPHNDYIVNATVYLNDVTVGGPFINSNFISYDQFLNLQVGNSTVGGQPVVGTSTYIITGVDSFGNVQNTSTINDTVVGQSAATSTTACLYPAGGITDIGGGIAFGLCNAGQFLFTPSGNFTAAFQSGLAQFQATFPFSLVYGIHNTLASSTNEFTASTTDSIDIPVPEQLTPYISSTVALVNSSTINNIVGGGTNGDTFHALVFAIEGGIMILGTVVIIYLQIAG